MSARRPSAKKASEAEQANSGSQQAKAGAGDQPERAPDSAPSAPTPQRKGAKKAATGSRAGVGAKRVSTQGGAQPGAGKATARVAARRPAAAPARGEGAAAPADSTVDSAGGAQEQAFEAERKLEGLIADVGAGDAAGARRAVQAMGDLASRLAAQAGPLPEERDEGLMSTARQLLSTDYYLKQWGRLGMRNRSERVDDFGLDRTYEAQVSPVLDALYDDYFRVQASGLEHVPPQGRALLVCNRGGALPWDGLMLKTAFGRQPQARELRWLAEDFAFHAPFLGAFLNRLGAVRACQENATRLLNDEQLVAVFPEGIKGVGKVYRQRYALQRFGRGGYVRLALRTGAPIYPVAVVGAEEAHPLLHKFRPFSRALGVPFIPVTPTFPWLGPLGLLPLPSRWRIHVGEPISGLDQYGPQDAEDEVVVNELNERIRGTVGELLQEAVSARGAKAFL